MVDYQTYVRILELFIKEKLNNTQIAKALGIDPRTVATWKDKERYEPQKRAPKTTLLDGFKGTIQAKLEQHNYSAVQIFQRIKEEGYKGEITTVRDYVRKIRPRQKKAFLTLQFTPGDYAQVDWGHCGTIAVGNSTRRLSVFVMVLCYSRMIYLELTLAQSQEHFLQCHRNAFEFFGGVPANIMVDNCKTAILEHRKYDTVVPNPRYADIAAHYGFTIRPCAIRQPQQKGRVEKAIDYVKRNFILGLKLDSFTMVTQMAKQWRDTVANQRVHGQTKKIPQELFICEKPHLIPLPIHAYDCAVIKTVRANTQFRITLDTNRYSVPAKYAGQKLLLSVYSQKLRLYCDEKLIAEHLRSYQRHQDIENPDHVKPLLQHRRRAKEQLMITAFLKLTTSAEAYYQALKEKQLNVLFHLRKILAMTEVYGQEKVARALEDAYEFKAFSADYIANILHHRHRLRSQAYALHLTRNEDLLDLDIPQVDLTIYNNIGNVDADEKNHSNAHQDHKNKEKEEK